MNANDLFEIIGEAQESYVLDALNGAQAPQRSRRRLSFPRAVLIAAVISLVLLLVGCAAVYVLRLQDLKIGEECGLSLSPVPENETAGTESIRDVIAIRGYPGSPNYLATREWYEFVRGCDPNSLPAEGNAINPLGIPENFYYGYECYTWEMVDKAKEISQKYGLELMSRDIIIQRGQIGVMFEALGIQGVCHPEKAARVRDGAARFYPEGNFKYEFSFLLPQGADTWPYEIPATMYYAKKDYFDPDYIGIESESYSQWDYTTADGTSILIAANSICTFFFAEQEDAFITVVLNTAMLLDSSAGQLPAREDMECAADLIDFTIQPRTPDLTGIEEKLAQAEADHRAALEAAAAQTRKTHMTYAAYVKDTYLDHGDDLIGTPYARDFYALADIDGDGADELLLGSRDDHFRDLLTIRDGEVRAIHAWSHMNLCTDGVILITEYFPLTAVADDLDAPRRLSYYRIAEGQDGPYLACIGEMDCSFETQQWCKVDPATGETAPASQEEAEAFRSLYPQAELEMRPLSDFPME